MCTTHNILIGKYIYIYIYTLDLTYRTFGVYSYVALLPVRPRRGKILFVLAPRRRHRHRRFVILLHHLQVTTAQYCSERTVSSLRFNLSSRADAPGPLPMVKISDTNNRYHKKKKKTPNIYNL